MECETSTSGNKHILTVICHLTGSRIHNISPSTEGLPNTSFMDHHHTCFIWRFGKTMEDVYPTENKITTVTKSSTTETTSSKLSTFSITGRISRRGQHLYTFQATHSHSHPTTEERIFFQWHVTIQQMHEEKHLTLLRGCLQLAYWNSHHQRCKGHQEKVNQLIETQTQQQETFVHVISILNITRYSMQVNRQHINTVMEAVERTHNNITTLFNISSSIYSHIH